MQSSSDEGTSFEGAGEGSSSSNFNADAPAFGYDEVFPALSQPSATPVPNSVWNTNKPRIGSSTVTQLFVISPSERKVGNSEKFGKKDNLRACTNIMHATNTTIEISADKNGELTFLVTGKTNDVAEAKRRVTAHFQTPSRNAHERVQVPKIYHPFICGGHNERLNQITADTHAEINVPPPSVQNDEITISGDKEGVQAAKDRILAIYHEMLSTIEKVPDVPLIHMMSYLNLKDRKNLRLTCKRFHELSYDLSLIKNDVLRLWRIEDLDTLPPISRYVNLNLRDCVITADLDLDTPPAISRYVNLLLSCCIIEKTFKLAQYWKSHGSVVKSMELLGSETNHPAFALILSHCPNVEELVLVAFDRYENRKKHEAVAPKFALKKLKRLELFNFENFEGLDVIETIFNDAPALVQLSINYSENLSKKEWERIITFIKKQPNILNELRFNQIEISNNLFIKLVDAAGPKLTRLWMRRISIIDPSGIEAIGKKLTNLRHLFYRDCDRRFEDDDYSYIDDAVIALPNLTEFNSNLLEGHPLALMKLQNLTTVLLSFSRLSAENLIAAFGEKELPQLLDFRLDYVGSVNCNVLCKICPNLPNLQRLSLDACFIKGKGLNAICKNNKDLKILSLQKCISIKYLKKFRLDNLIYIGLDDVSILPHDIEGLVRKCPKLLRIGGHSPGPKILRERRRLRPFAFSGDYKWCGMPLPYYDYYY